MAHPNFIREANRLKSFRSLQRPRILALYRDLMKTIPVFTSQTHPYDDFFAAQLASDTRDDFKKNKNEMRPKNLVNFLRGKRELLDTLLAANESIG